MKNSLTEKGLSATVFWLPLVSIIMYAGLLFSFFGSFSEKKFKLSERKTGLDYAVLIFTFVVFLSMLFSAVRAQSIYGFIAFCAYPIAYFVFSRNMNSAGITRFNELAVLSFIAVLAGAVIQVLLPGSFTDDHKKFFDLLGLIWGKGLQAWPGTRLASTLGNSNVFGAYLVLVLPVFLCLLLQKPSLKLYILFFAGILCLLFTYSRSAWIGFFFSIVIVSVISRKRILFLLCLLIFVPFLLMPGLNHRLVSIVKPSRDYGSYGRQEVWQTSIKIIKKFPLLGTGVNSFYHVYPEFQPQGSVDRFPHAHNIFLNLGVETGLSGVITFGILIFLFFRLSLGLYRKFRSRDKNELPGYAVLGMIGGTSGFMVQNMFDYFLSRGQIGVLFWIIMGLMRGLDEPQGTREQDGARPK